MVEAADLLADPDRQPVFFHCVAGHHRSSLAHAAYLIRHCGWPAEAAWKEVAALPWARPGAQADLDDRALIEAFARSQQICRSGRRLAAVRLTMTTTNEPGRDDRRGRFEWASPHVVSFPLCYVAWDQATYNFGTVQPGRIYRSGQMPARALEPNDPRTSHQDSLESCEARTGSSGGIVMRSPRRTGRGRPRSTSRCRLACGCRVLS